MFIIRIYAFYMVYKSIISYFCTLQTHNMRSSNYLYLNTRDTFYRLDINKIVLFQAQGNYTTFILANKHKGMLGVNLGRMSAILNERLGDNAARFARIGRNFIINLTLVYKIDLIKKTIIMSDNATFAYQLSVSKEAVRQLRDIFVNPMAKEDKSNGKA